MNVLIAVLALAGDFGASAALAGAIEVDDREPVVLTSDVEIPEGWSPLVEWDVDKPAKGREFDNGQTLAVWAPPGTHEVTLSVTMAKVAENGGIEFRKLKKVYVLKVRGPPEPPTPPGPAPPDPTKVPFPSAGFAFLIIKEASETGRLPVSQRNILTSSELLKYGRDNTVTYGGDPFFRVWDDDFSDADLANVGAHLKEAYRLVKPKSLPWIAISNGKTGYEGPLPQTLKDTLELLEKYRK